MIAERNRNDITAIIPDRLYRVGCTVKIDHMSWIPAGTEGLEPINCYVVLEDEEAIFIDVLPAIAEPVIKDALDTIVGNRRVSVWPTRNEGENIGNLGFVFGTAHNPRLLWGSGGGILEWINDPAVPLLESRNFMGRIPIITTPAGSKLVTGPSTRFHYLDAVVKCMFLTQWCYEEHSKTLFTSDMFGWRHLKSIDDSVIVGSNEGNPSVEVVAAEIAARVNWLPGSVAPDLPDRLRKVFSDFDVEVVAPVHGCVLKGRDVVRANLELAINAIESLTVSA